jgi:ABC-type multidrug transport system ATPase subunit
MTVDRLRNLLDSIGEPVTSIQLAEMIWLAGHIQGGERERERGPAQPREQAPAAADALVMPHDGADKERPAPDTLVRETRHSLFAPPVPPLGQAAMDVNSELDAGQGRENDPRCDADTVLVPAAPMLGQTLAVQRALRPFKRRVPSGRLRVFDEGATAAKLAEHPDQRPWIPVLAPARERWLSLVLIVDTGPAMAVWRPLASELREALSRLGAFRDVRVRFLEVVMDSVGVSLTKGGPALASSSLIDSTGRQAILVLSDCSGQHWWDGRAGRAVHLWARNGPAAILQPLAERLWRRTATPVFPGQATLARFGAPNTELRHTPHDGPITPLPRTVPVPVMEVSADWLADWARLVTASDRARDIAVTYVSDRILPLSEPLTVEEDLPVDDRVLRFYSEASAGAAELAARIAVGVPYLPVMQLIQHQIMPWSHPGELAEVLLSGLLRTVDGVPGLYDFVPGARTALLRTLPRPESQVTAEVLERISMAVQERAGAAPRTFQAIMSVMEGTGTISVGGGGRPFALVSPEALTLLSHTAAPLAPFEPVPAMPRADPPLGSRAPDQATSITAAETRAPSQAPGGPSPARATAAPPHGLAEAPPSAGPAGDSAVPALVVRTRTSEYTLHGGTTYRIGRDPKSDIVLTDSRVSWRHGTLQVERGSWLLEDVGSTNGTFVGLQRTDRVPIVGDSVVRLANPDDGPVLRCMQQAADPVAVFPALLPSVGRRPTARMPLPAKAAVRIGRIPDNDLVLPDLDVSRHHAEIRRSPTGTYEIVDLSSHNGTYVNGHRVSSAVIGEDDIISIGRSTFRLVGGELRQFVDDGEINFSAQNLVVKVAGGKVLLDGITFALPELSMMAIIGPAGTGKTTLLNALAGKRPADQGRVLYENQDLYKNSDALKDRIGHVPQESLPVIMGGIRPRGLVRRTASLVQRFDRFTPKTALQYVAEARLPTATESEQSQRVDEVLAELSIAQHANTKLDLLSVGQQKRVAIGLELVTRPSLLFLDEPTAQLDASTTRELFRLMREMATVGGQSVVLTTHDVESKLLDLGDRILVLAPGGRMAYFGPPGEGLRYFGVVDWADAFQALTNYPDRDWAAEYTASPAYAQYAIK